MSSIQVPFPIPGGKILLFGPQALSFDEKSASQLRTALLESPSLTWILDAINELPRHWDALASAVPVLKHYPGAHLLNDLSDWLNVGKFANATFPLQNILLTPLVVIIHLSQYVEFLEKLQSGASDAHDSLKHDAETLGLCTGLLSAAAISCSADQLQLRHYGAVAVRLAMAAGALVDALEQSEGESKSFSLAWNSPEMGAKVAAILDKVPEAYISVLYDKRRATLTCTKTVASSVQEKLKAAGVIVGDVGLRGSFHSQSHQRDVEKLLQFCDSHSAFQFIQASELELPTRSNTDGGDYITTGKLHHVVLNSMLLRQSNWHEAFTSLQSTALTREGAQIISFGPEHCVPSVLVRTLGNRLTQASDFISGATSLLNQVRPSNTNVVDSAIAVIGMSCQLPGASDMEEFRALLQAGKSQHIEVPEDRFGFETQWRDLDSKRKWYGNFIDNYDTFDHKFFKKSPREMSSTDPQHRLMLQAAYQAVEQSGYFSKPDMDKHIGCYIGFGLVDYERNIACYPANAYSATGNLKSFAAGKISHYFGWTGPGLTIDTACSSSAVAIHTACRAIISGEVSAALAGGVNIMTSPEWYQNLAGASFLSPTGQCKPFDTNADGYCRGEAVGAIFLKKLSAAIEDGDQIFGVIGGSAVYQNQNCTAITVPNAPSLSGLFSDAARLAGLQPTQISVVEAHGTGTIVGDRAEYSGILKTFGGSCRTDTLSLGSVKGLLGHTESASGIVAILKILLMIREGFIPPQPSFSKINPALNHTDEDRIEIATSLKKWDVGFRAALINNYGASGSNATLVITEAPGEKGKAISEGALSNQKYPFWLSGLDDKELRNYSSKLRKYLDSKPDLSIQNLSFQVARQSNRSLDTSLIFSCKSIKELQEKLSSFEDGSKGVSSIPRPGFRPVILTCGGQISKFIGLDKQIYDNVKIFRRHIDQCNTTCQSLGLSGIFPEIFQRTPIEDIVKLQTALFAMQYSCAKTWIDCGIEVAALVGHSFGELTALCVSGVLSLKDALKMISGRARLIQESWNTERGAMIAVEADLAEVEKLLLESSERFNGTGEEAPASIACFNGPQSFTIAGSTKAIDALGEILRDRKGIKSKRLSVTHAFHSSLVEPLMEDLERIGHGIAFNEATLPLERTTETEFGDKLSAKLIADHMRNPVFFHHAVQRLSKKYPAAVFLEAGSNSTVTMMAARALGSPKSSHFQGINLTSEGSFQFLTEATEKLWKEGVNVCFWPHHRVQTADYTPLLLPPYQFEKTKHWMELKKPQQAIMAPSVVAPQVIELPKGLWTFVGYQDGQQRVARFRVNTMIEKFSNYINGHIIVKTAPLCPSTLQLDIAIDALMSLRSEFADSTFQPQLQDMQSHAPMGLDPSKLVWLNASSADPQGVIWDWKIASENMSDSSSIMHVSGRIIFRAANDPQYHSDFARYERLVERQRCLTLLDGKDADEVIQGRNIYKTFGEIVEYAEVYRGLEKIAGKGNKSAGRITKTYTKETWLDVGLADSFCQVAGIYINSMTDRPESEMYISDKIETWIRSPGMGRNSPRPETWECFASHHRPSEKEVISDVFVFDSSSGALLEVILGIHYHRVGKAGLSKMLARLSPGTKILAVAAPSVPANIQIQTQMAFSDVHGMNAIVPPSPPTTPSPKAAKFTAVKAKSSRPDVSGPIRDILCNLSGLEPEEIKSDSGLVELGIDSLMGMELAREIEVEFKITLSTDQLLDLTDFNSLVICVKSTLGEPGEGEAVDQEDHSPTNGVVPQVDGINGPHDDSVPYINGTSQDTSLSAEIVLESFAESKRGTDQFIAENRLGNYMHQVLPRSTELCIVHILDAFDDLGCSIRNAKQGSEIKRIEYLPRHQQMVKFVYDLLEKEARLIDIEGSRIIRTGISCPTKSADALLQELVKNFPDTAWDHKLTFLAGAKLADCLIGKVDGIQLLFGTAEGRETASGMYAESPINLVWLKQIEDFFQRLLLKLPKGSGPIKILEMGAGTGGTTSKMIPLLAGLGVPVEYTITDISPSLVAAARKRFRKYPFVKFQVFDIEQGPTPEQVQSQHIVLATNCVHATHSLATSTRNIRKVLLPSGFLLMLEMTETLPWIDLIFGLVEGWWFFDDGRRHALAPPAVWEKTLHEVGYGHVDWTEGDRPEASVQRLIIALAESPRYDRVSVPAIPQPSQVQSTNVVARQAAVDGFVKKYTGDFTLHSPGLKRGKSGLDGHCVIITGANGSLGSHLVEYFAQLSTTRQVICLNRHSTAEATQRQHEALISRGISLSQDELSKLKVLEGDTSKPFLGLPSSEFEYLIEKVTLVIHNAWPMSISRPVNGFEGQFKAMRNLINLARDSSAARTQKIGFQFISSIATVGFYPLWSGNARVPEEPMNVESVLSNGYGDAKLVCERILEQTLNRYPDEFRAMTVRIGQIAGSKSSGYWNPVEHLAFVIKSSQSLRILPDFEGELSWCPVNDVAATLGELLTSDVDPYPVYHIENPARQSWPEMIRVLADALNIPANNIVPFQEWVNRVRRFPGSIDIDNPAGRLVGFLDQHFIRMSCGELILDTKKSTERSRTLRNEVPVSAALVRKYISTWKDRGFLRY